MSIKSWFGVAAGAFVALALPVATWILGLSLEGTASTAEEARLRAIAIEQVRPLTDLALTLAPAELVLGPLGVFIVGRSAAIRGTRPWVLLGVATIPVLTFVWLLGLLTLGGALGSPL